MKVSNRFAFVFLLDSVLMACITEPGLKGIAVIIASWILMYCAYKAGLYK